MRALFVSILATVLLPAAAHAQTWPTDTQWRVLMCDGMPAYDPVGDQPGAVNERDVVGDSTSPALYFFADTQFVYFRMRIDATPLTAMTFSPSAWGVELDTDGVHDDYELLCEVDGISMPDRVVLGRNTMTVTPNDPADPIESIATTYTIATHARAVLVAAPFTSSFGGNEDWFVDWAIDLRDLTAEGVTPATPLSLVAGTSTNAMGLNADIACQDGRTGPADLVHAFTSPVRPDGVVVVDSDGDGFSDMVETAAGTNPNDPNSYPGSTPSTTVGIRGGPGGCSVGGGASGLVVALFALLGCAAIIRRRAE